MKRGFTIVELLVVIVVIGILATVVLVAYNGVSGRAVTASLQTDLANAKKQLENYRTLSSTGSYPISLNCSGNLATQLCLNASAGNTFTYTAGSVSNPKSYSLIAKNGNVSYQLSSSSAGNGDVVPEPISNGIIVELDAGNTSSYSGTGTTWTDLTGNGNNASLVGAPTYSSVNGGFFSFTPSSYASLPSASALFPGPAITGTFESWIRPYAYDAVYIGIQNPSDKRLYVGQQSSGWDTGLGSCFWGNCLMAGSVRLKTELAYWTHVAVVLQAGTAKLYINGVETTSKSQTNVNLSGIFTIGVYFVNGAYGGSSGSSDIASFRVYNRALSISEVTQNFNALRSRFGV